MEERYSQPYISAFTGITLIVAYVSAISLYAYTFGVYASNLTPSIHPRFLVRSVFSTLVLLAFIGLNLTSVKTVGAVESVIVTAKIVVLLIFSLTAILVARDGFTPHFSPFTLTHIMFGSPLMFIAFEGFELISNTIEDLKNPEKNLSKAIYLSIFIVTAIYILVCLSIALNISRGEMNGEVAENILAYILKASMGGNRVIFISLGTLLATSSAINAALFGVSRVALVMSREKQLPRIFEYVKSEETGVPWSSTVLIGLLAIALTNSITLIQLSSLASAMFILVYLLVNYSCLEIAEKLNARRIIPALAIILCLIEFIILALFLAMNNQLTNFTLPLMICFTLSLMIGYKSKKSDRVP